ncbi:hypothetical protein RRG08_039783 [Elysia crispata]|uniref:Uncharacterized protein n=1 Tax=Elysia crispata TaxID=231223 RepID=A0AAE1AS06_9GAST|nr:hypothetical protein RRG08_039783 [Elysia crispata]
MTVLSIFGFITARPCVQPKWLLRRISATWKRKVYLGNLRKMMKEVLAPYSTITEQYINSASEASHSREIEWASH